MLGTYHLNALFEILNKLHFVYQPGQLWQFVVEQAAKTVQAEAGTYYELHADQETLTVTSAFGVDANRLREIPMKVGMGITGWVAHYHQAALVTDVRQDNRFNRKIDLVTGFNTRSILAVPVFSQKKTYGVLEVLNRKSGQFSPQDQEFMTLLGRQAAVAYQNLLLLDEVSHTKTLLESLVSNLSGGLMAIDLNKRITILNPAAVSILQLPKVAYTGKPVAEIPAEARWFTDTLEKTLESKTTVSRQEISLVVDGQSTRIGYTTILIVDPQKAVLGSGIIFQKLTN